jgi:hypothetical protein
MAYLNLAMGTVVLIVFGMILRRNSKRKGFFQAFIQFDILIGFAAGLYLVITSIVSLSA